MASSYIPWWMSALWISLALLTFLALDPTSLRNWLMVTTIGIVPCLLLLKLWSDGPSPTVTEVLHATEARR